MDPRKPCGDAEVRAIGRAPFGRKATPPQRRIDLGERRTARRDDSRRARESLDDFVTKMLQNFDEVAARMREGWNPGHDLGLSLGIAFLILGRVRWGVVHFSTSRAHSSDRSVSQPLVARSVVYSDSTCSQCGCFSDR
jgi:hypothetical protein